MTYPNEPAGAPTTDAPTDKDAELLDVMARRHELKADQADNSLTARVLLLTANDLRRIARRLRGGATAPTPDPREVALRDLLDRYVSLVESGDAGHWDAEEEPVVIAARAALRRDAGASYE